MDVKLVVWDFDGVLNRNIIDEEFIWTRTFERDWGQPVGAFQRFMFGADFDRVITGRQDLRARIKDWLQMVASERSPEEFMAYWFQHDYCPDSELLALAGHLAGAGQRQVILTNNEAHRARFIARQPEVKGRFERIFASGELGVAKPDHAVYQLVADRYASVTSEILLIDGMPANVLAARCCGWQALQFRQDCREDVIARLSAMLG